MMAIIPEHGSCTNCLLASLIIYISTKTHIQRRMIGRPEENHMNENVLFLARTNAYTLFENQPKNVSSNLSYLNTMSNIFYIVWKWLKMSHLNFGIFHQLCPIKIDLSGNTVWPQASGFQKLAKIDQFWHF